MMKSQKLDPDVRREDPEVGKSSGYRARPDGVDNAGKPYSLMHVDPMISYLKT